MNDFNEEKLDEMLTFLHTRTAPCAFRVKKGYKVKLMKKKVVFRTAAAALAIVLAFSAVFFSRQLFGAGNRFTVYANAASASPNELEAGRIVEFKDALDWQTISYGWDHLRASLAFRVNVGGENISSVTYTAHGAPFLVRNDCEQIIDSVPFEAEPVYQEGYGGYPALRTSLIGYSEVSSYTVAYDDQPAMDDPEDEGSEPVHYPVGLEILWLYGEKPEQSAEDEALCDRLKTFIIKAHKLDILEREKNGEEVDPEEYAIFDEYPEEKYDVEYSETVSTDMMWGFDRLMRDKFVQLVSGITVDVTAHYRNGAEETKTVCIGTEYSEEDFIADVRYTMQIGN